MKKHSSIIILFATVALLLSGCGTSQNTVTTSKTTTGREASSYERYIATYHPVAIAQMERYNIPASITLAQGLLESGAGTSKLTEKSNNHFGIKADKSWKGRRTSAMDNGRMCYFRAYDNAMESYEDHSKFLANRSHYAFLFDLKKTDYKAWARGLKKAGYAEDPAYPSKLINLIERYELYKYDTQSTRSSTKYTIGTGSALAANVAGRISMGGTRPIYRANELMYIIADTGDTFKSLAKETGVSRRKLIKYNDLYKNYAIKAGDIIYLEKKNTKALKPYKFHTTENGESLYTISQKYGIRLKKLLDMNPQFREYATLKVGDIVRLR